MIGTNLLFDGISYEIKKISDEKTGTTFLNYLADVLSLTKIGSPKTFKFPIINGMSGYTSFILLAESHISIHTWPEKNLLAIDIFSCKDFNAKKAEQEIIKFFNVESYNSQVFIRKVPVKIKLKSMG